MAAWSHSNGCPADLQILADGKILYVLFRNQDGTESAYALDGYAVHQFALNIESQPISFPGMNAMMAGPSSHSLDLGVTGTGQLTFIHADRGQLLMDLDFFRDMTVRDLFSEINKKLNGRKKGSK